MHVSGNSSRLLNRQRFPVAIVVPEPDVASTWASKHQITETGIEQLCNNEVRKGYTIFRLEIMLYLPKQTNQRELINVKYCFCSELLHWWTNRSVWVIPLICINFSHCVYYTSRRHFRSIPLFPSSPSFYLFCTPPCHRKTYCNLNNSCLIGTAAEKGNR